MHDRLITPEVLQRRSDAIILNMHSMVRNGMDPKWIRDLEKESPRRRKDLTQVQLGTKPAAIHLAEPFETFGDLLGEKSFLSYFPSEKDTGIIVVFDQETVSVWNPDLVIKTLNDHPEYSEGIPSPYDHSSFADFLEKQGPSKKEGIAFGLLLGYPQIAVERFVEYNGSAWDAANFLWEKAATFGIPILAPEPLVLLDLHETSTLHNPEIKKEFIRLAKLFQYPDQEIIEYVASLRPADVPGWQFLTSGNLTTKEEQQMREAYDASRFDAKLDRFLTSYGV